MREKADSESVAFRVETFSKRKNTERKKKDFRRFGCETVEDEFKQEAQYGEHKGNSA